jgi:parvulin-like peptidyl-prolyl isomerase
MVCGAVMILNVAGCDRQDNKQVLASIGKYEVTDRHFQNAFKSYYYKTGQAIPVNERTLKAVLDGELERYTVVTWAEDRGWHSDASGNKQRSLIERQVYMQEYERLMVHQAVGVDESDLRELFRRFNSRVRASHLYAPDRATADDIYKRLQNGETFEMLAAEIFTNKHLSQNAGDLGYFTIDEMDPAFENIAFRMGIGEVSPPVRTNQGYSIIKVTDVVTKPIVTETEFASRRAALSDYALQRNREMATRRDLETLTNEVEIDEKIVEELFLAMNGTTEGTRFDVNLPENTPVAKLRSFEMSIQDFRAEAALLPNWRFASRKALREIIDGIVYRSYAINAVKNHPKFDSEIAALTVEATFHSWLIERFNEYLDQAVIVSETELRALFNSNPEFRTSQIELNVGELVTSSEADAHLAIKALKSGTSFKTVLLQYGVMGEALLYDGELGFRPIDSFGRFASNLRELKPSEVVGPLEYTPDRWIVYQCIGRNEPRPISFEQARQNLIEIRKVDEVKKLRNAIIEETKKVHGARADYEKMKTVTITI